MTTVSVKSRRLIARLGALRTRHARIDEVIATERKRPMADAFKLQSLKKMKLKVKDEIEALRARIGARSMA